MEASQAAAATRARSVSLRVRPLTHAFHAFPSPQSTLAGAKTRKPESEVLPFIWAQLGSGERQLAWLVSNGKLNDGSSKLKLELDLETATRAGLAAYVGKTCFSRGVLFVRASKGKKSKKGWDAAVDAQFVTGRVWSFTGRGKNSVQGTLTEATLEEAEVILGPYNASKVAK